MDSVIMKTLGEYFTWPLFVIRFTLVCISLPILLIISTFLTSKFYMDDKLERRESSIINSLFKSIKMVFGTVGLYILLGRKAF